AEHIEWKDAASCGFPSQETSGFRSEHGRLEQADGENCQSFRNGRNVGAHIAHVHCSRESLDKECSHNRTGQIKAASGERSSAHDDCENCVQFQKQSGMVEI